MSYNYIFFEIPNLTIPVKDLSISYAGNNELNIEFKIKIEDTKFTDTTKELGSNIFIEGYFSNSIIFYNSELRYEIFIYFPNGSKLDGDWIIMNGFGYSLIQDLDNYPNFKQKFRDKKLNDLLGL